MCRYLRLVIHWPLEKVFKRNGIQLYYTAAAKAKMVCGLETHGASTFLAPFYHWQVISAMPCRVGGGTLTTGSLLIGAVVLSGTAGAVADLTGGYQISFHRDPSLLWIYQVDGIMADSFSDFVFRR